MYPLFEKIKELEPAEIFEIGPGLGVMSRELAKLTDLHMIEFDTELVKILKEDTVLGKHKITHQDFLKVNLSEMVDSQKKNVITGNIPYHISSSVLLKILENITLFCGVGLMVQKEFAKRLIAKENTKEYGRLSVISQLHGNISELKIVPKELFKPVPKVDSMVFWIEPFEKTPSKEWVKTLGQITHHGFSKRRKTIRNSLAPYIEQIEELGWDLQKRAENVPVDDYRFLCDLVIQK